jgi:hypothetical protein
LFSCSPPVVHALSPKTGMVLKIVCHRIRSVVIKISKIS